MYTVELPPPHYLGEADRELLDVAAKHARESSFIQDGLATINSQASGLHFNKVIHQLLSELFDPVKEQLEGQHEVVSLTNIMCQSKVVSPGDVVHQGRASLWHQDTANKYRKEILVANFAPTETVYGSIDFNSDEDPALYAMSKQTELIEGHLAASGGGYRVLEDNPGLCVSQALPYVFAEIPYNTPHRAPLNYTSSETDRFLAIAQFQVSY